ncbi:hypothetical protein MHL40_16555 [Pseudomonas luteola]|uniref:hypothetical protein n=1 Tax=Pseudomonas luteola TaxID=47886 RepID=UPI001EF6FA28|nr:hypothetical protein [Pseudomonas luteola]MCG7374265.1 hypothetical protein [Pseudomonas luteola]
MATSLKGLISNASSSIEAGPQPASQRLLLPGEEPNQERSTLGSVYDRVQEIQRVYDQAKDREETPLERSLDHMYTGMKIGGGVGGAVGLAVSQIKEKSKHDDDSLEIASSLAANPAAAVAGYAAVQLAGDKIDNKTMAYTKLAVAGAGLAMGGPVILGVGSVAAAAKGVYDAFHKAPEKDSAYQAGTSSQAPDSAPVLYESTQIFEQADGEWADLNPNIR